MVTTGERSARAFPRLCFFGRIVIYLFEIK